MILPVQIKPTDLLIHLPSLPLFPNQRSITDVVIYQLILFLIYDAILITNLFSSQSTMQSTMYFLLKPIRDPM